MRVRCPGCMASLNVDDESYKEKVLLQCPDCLFVFLARPGEEEDEGDDAPGDATLLTSDAVPESDAREFQWNVPGASLTIIEGDSQGIHRKLKEQKLVIGRKGAGLVLEDKAVSRRHCEIEKRGDAWFVKDLGSKNGTLVNGKKVSEQRLHHLDEIKVGNARLLFAESEAQMERAPEEIAESSLDVTKVDDKSKERELKLPRGREFFLEYMTGPKKGRSIKFEKARVIIGRGEEADLDLDDKGVSRKHVMIEIHSREQIYISDLASQNGTWLNGMRIRMTKLIHGDKIRMGNTVLKFIAQDLL
ncbi:MAG TPA: FHA domain-containing protein [bacterium]|nr:FHA domain-containing protein [bacterium]